MPHAPRPIQLRLATADDAPRILRDRLADPGAGPGDQRMAAYLRGEHHPQKALAPRVAFMALDGAAVIGYTAGHLTRRFDCDGELQYLFVASAYRRQGVARALVARLASWFAAQGATRVCVNVDLESDAAGKFYRALGATELGRAWMEWRDVRVLLPPDRGEAPARDP